MCICVIHMSSPKIELPFDWRVTSLLRFLPTGINYKGGEELTRIECDTADVTQAHLRFTVRAKSIVTLSSTPAKITASLESIELTQAETSSATSFFCDTAA